MIPIICGCTRGCGVSRENWSVVSSLTGEPLWSATGGATVWGQAARKQGGGEKEPLKNNLSKITGELFKTGHSPEQGYTGGVAAGRAAGWWIPVREPSPLVVDPWEGATTIGGGSL